MSTVLPGVCRHCGCTEDDACTLPTNDACCWKDAERTVCSNPACIKAEAARKARAPRSKYAGWGYGAIVEDLRKQRRPSKRSARRKGKAA